MAVTTVNAYLGFNGTAAKALQFYERALGAKTEHVMRWSEGPPGMPVPPEARDRIMHAEVTIGGGKIMAADAPPHMPSPADSNITVCLGLDDNDDMKKKFDALSAGGQVAICSCSCYVQPWIPASFQCSEARTATRIAREFGAWPD